MVAPRRCSSLLTVLAHVDVFGRAWDLHAMIAGVAADDRRHAGASRSACARTPTARTSWASATRGSTACAARFRLEHGLLLGGAVILVGLVARRA